jgi:polyisoprenoid-binding protein YceI
MMKRVFLRLAGALALWTCLLPAHAAVFGSLVPGQSKIGFVSKQMGVPVSGQFRRFSGQFVFDPARPEAGKARIEVELASIDAGSGEANEEAVGKDWFHVKSFPGAVFEMRRVKPLGGNRFEVQGSLTIKGRSRDVTASVTFRENGGNGIFEGGFILKRLDFGIGEGPWGDPGTVADEVQVNWILTLRPVPAPAPAKK